MADKKYEEASIQAIANAIRSKNGSQATYKVSEMAAAISNISTFTDMGTGRTIKNNSNSSTSDVTADFTIPANCKEAFLIVFSMKVGNNNTFSLARQSGATVTITTQIANTVNNWDAFGASPRHMATITYKIAKTDTTASVVRLKISNPYGFAGACAHLVTNLS